METPLKPNINIIDQESNDKTFIRLKQLQNLIKKESTLKELCKK